MVVVELPTADSPSVYQTIMFMKKLKERLNPGNGCTRLGFIFAWEKAISVINLSCDYQACYSEGLRIADNLDRRSFNTDNAYNRSEVVKGINMAAKELLPSGVDLESHGKKARFNFLRY